MHGGFCIARVDPDPGRYLYGLSHPVEDTVRFVVISPENRVLTEAAREVLPENLGLPDVVKSINSVAAVVSIFATGQYNLLGNAVADYIHQPYREKLNPFMKETISAGVEAGAWCGWLSGSGSSILCVCPEAASAEVGQAMQHIFKIQGIGSRLYFLKADNAGLTVV
jgi:homoserine kinase